MGPNRRWVAAAALVVAVLALYARSLGGEPVFDDDAFLFENPLIHAPDGLRRFWLSTEPPDYFPLTSTSLWLEWRLWGADPLGYHAVNVALHALACVLLWRVLERLAVPGAWWAALLFAVHPVNVESVAWITQRKNTLPLVFALLALAAWLRSEQAGDPQASQRAYATSLAAYLLALFAKTSVVVLPPILLVLAWWRSGRATRRDLLRSAPFFALALALGLVTLWYQSTQAIAGEVVRDDGLLSRLALAARAVWFYLEKAFWPLGLAMIHPRWEADVASPATWLPLAALVALVAALWRARARPAARGALAALAVYVLALAPVLGFVDVYFMRFSLVSDHWQHLALIAPVAWCGAALARAGERFHARALLPAAGGALAAALAALAWRGQAAYRDEIELWAHTLAVNPAAWAAEYNLGRALEERGASEVAIAHYERALALNAGYADARFNLARALVALGRAGEALPHFEALAASEPDDDLVHGYWGVALHVLGRPAEALARFERALELQPARADTHFNRGLALAALGRWREALDAQEEALRLEPELDPARAERARCLQALERGR